MKEKSFAPGETIYQKDDVDYNLYFINSGKVCKIVDNGINKEIDNNSHKFEEIYVKII